APFARAGYPIGERPGVPREVLLRLRLCPRSFYRTMQRFDAMSMMAMVASRVKKPHLGKKPMNFYLTCNDITLDLRRPLGEVFIVWRRGRKVVVSKPVKVDEVLDPVDGRLTVTATFNAQDLALLCTIFLGEPLGAPLQAADQYSRPTPTPSKGGGGLCLTVRPLVSQGEKGLPRLINNSNYLTSLDSLAQKAIPSSYATLPMLLSAAQCLRLRGAPTAQHVAVG
ncbi:hypothetical protein T492DRAFT_1122117, partial [Pavlovales sp. CCMP2436]